jgi:hypothetical protein
MIDPRLHRLIERSFSRDSADAFRTFSPSDAEVEILAAVGKRVLTGFPPVAGGCAIMSALYGALLEAEMPAAPTYVVAGALDVGSQRVFGLSERGIDWDTAFSASNFDWDGHCWVVCGDLIADVSIFRTAYSSASPPALAHYVVKEFGQGRGLMVARDTAQLRYIPWHVLTYEQVTGLARGAVHFAQGGDR